MIYHLCLLFCCQQAAVQLEHAALTESSGVCVSADGRVVWTHNDSGDTPRLFGFRRGGELAMIANVQRASAVDWEDICSFERDGKAYLAVGDVGDNQRRRKAISIYVLQEPKLGSFESSSQSPIIEPQQPQTLEVEVPVVGEFHITFPGGPLDCEGIAYDPLRKVFLLVSKEFLRARLFEVDASKLESKQSCQAVLMGTVLVPMVTGADISRDGQQLVLATYGPGCMLRRNAEGNWSTAGNDMRFFEVPNRKQGESICFDRNGQSLLLTSEFAPSPLYSVPAP